MPSATVQVIMPIPLAQKVEAEASKRGMSLSAFIRSLIEAGLNANPSV